MSNRPAPAWGGIPLYMNPYIPKYVNPEKPTDGLFRVPGDQDKEPLIVPLRHRGSMAFIISEEWGDDMEEFLEKLNSKAREETQDG